MLQLLCFQIVKKVLGEIANLKVTVLLQIHNRSPQKDCLGEELELKGCLMEWVQLYLLPVLVYWEV